MLRQQKLRVRCVAVLLILFLQGCSTLRQVGLVEAGVLTVPTSRSELIGRSVVVEYSDGRRIEGTLQAIIGDFIRLQTQDEFKPTDIPINAISQILVREGDSSIGIGIAVVLGIVALSIATFSLDIQ